LHAVNNARRDHEQLRVECGDRDAQDILNDAIDRVPGFEVPFDIPAAERRLQIGLASLAIGDREFSRALLEHLRGADYLLLVARFYLWSATDTALRAELARIDRTLSEVEPFAELHELAVALESIGAGAEAAAVRARAANAHRRILPDWEAHDCNELPAASPADTVNVFVHALLGAAPDAPRGRLRLRLCLPDWMETLTVHNLRMGDALVTLQCVRADNAFSYRVEQIAGAMPIRLIFEPTFSRPVTSAHVDDMPADLAVQPVGTRLVAPVQLVLDHERLIRFQT
jgi:hypothetical protein